jgi:3-oxoacyl-[acyl-carrier protein] reductase
MPSPADRPVALITGAASGIGAATAKRLAARGCNIVVDYSRNAAGAEATAAACRALGAEALVLQADIADDAACRDLVQKTFARFGRLDILVNNAGRTRHVPAENLEALTSADFDAVFGLNVRGAFQMARAAVPVLQEAPTAAIVNISSDSGLSGDGSSLAYAASKGALNTLTLGLARTLAPRIRVNAVCPGYVDTDWALAWQDEARHARFRDEVVALSPLKLIPSADDIAEAVEWLALGARCVTGQLIVIDAGTHLTAGRPLAPPPGT